MLNTTPRRFTPGKGTRYPSYRRLDGPQCKSGQRKISPPTEIRSLDQPLQSSSKRNSHQIVPCPLTCRGFTNQCKGLQKIEPCATRSCWQTWQSPSETCKSRRKFPNYRLAVIYTTIVRPRTKLGREDVSIPYIQQLNIILKSSFKLSGTSSDAERNKNTRYWLLQTAAGHHFTIYKSPPWKQFKMASNL